MIEDPKEYREKVFAWAESVGLKTVRLVIIQPEVDDEPTEYQLPLSELEEFAAELHRGIDRCRRAETAIKFMPREAWNREFLHPDPTDDVCRWCKAQATCPAVQEKIQRVTKADFRAVIEGAAPMSPEAFTPLDLEEAMKLVPLLETWGKSVRAEMERRAMAGEEFKDFGLELGRQGNRRWLDPAEAQDVLRKKIRLRMEDVFNMELRSPTQIETLTKPTKDEKGNTVPPLIGARQWANLCKMVTRADAKVSVKPKAAIRHPYVVEKPTAEGFMPVTPDDDEDFSA
jgi:hypothetical protein